MSLSSLPVELLERVTSFLPLDAFSNLRLANKSIADASIYIFGQKYFKIRQHMISRYSLESLVQISQSRLAPYVRELYIGTEWIYDQKLGEMLMESVEESNCKRLVNEQNSLVSSGDDTRLLTKALNAFDNCHTAGVKAQNRGYNPKRSFGANQIFREVGFHPDYILEALEIIIRPYESFALPLLAARNALKSIRDIQLVMDMKVFCHFNYADGFYLPISNIESLRPFLNELKVLNLVEGLDLWSTRRDFDYTLLSTLLSSVPKLTSLKINFPSKAFASTCYPILKSFTDLVEDGQILDSVTDLDLSYLNTTEDDLVTFLTEFTPSVKHLRLENVDLVSGSWKSVFQRSNSLRTLNSIEVRSLQVGNSPAIVILKKRSRDYGRDLRQISNAAAYYQGKHMTSFVDDLAENVYTARWRPPPRP
ncbi:hypothetical protein M501DRAFT_1016983 [Patellaria atrata CBS 101060]|uniref:F-box domain-containing protein n=1 Tax=Patellaria atrata CBS 101060 TaxID=1346257 RepID=A0A9P4VSU2_9PEZI|nr:hypothetical protein M501DRAFT_1016983 [Patellaria atrata CBS 101060]